MADLGIDDYELAPPDENGGLDPIPYGVYTLEVIESDKVPVKNDGQQITLTISVIEGPFSNRKIWMRHTWKNNSADAERIGRQQVSELCRAVGMNSYPENTVEFHGIPFQAKVGLDKPTPGYAPRNEIKKYLSAGNAPAPQQRQAAPAQQTRPVATTRPSPASTAAGKPAWFAKR